MYYSDPFPFALLEDGFLYFPWFADSSLCLSEACHENSLNATTPTFPKTNKKVTNFEVFFTPSTCRKKCLEPASLLSNVTSCIHLADLSTYCPAIKLLATLNLVSLVVCDIRMHFNSYFTCQCQAFKFSKSLHENPILKGMA